MTLDCAINTHRLQVADVIIAVKKPKKSETPTLRVDETTRKVLNSHESVSDDELGSERKIPNKGTLVRFSDSYIECVELCPPRNFVFQFIGQYVNELLLKH